MPTMTEEIAANVLEAQKFSRKHLVLELNLTPFSVEELEGQIDTVGYSLRGGKSSENVDKLSRIWGCYLGEVIRRTYGGDWVVVDEGDQQRWALRGRHGDVFPLEHVRRRLTEGSSANIYQYLLDAAQVM